MNPIIFFDVDGTLISGDKKFYRTALLRKRIAALIVRGYVFGVNTNRPWLETCHVYNELKLNGPLILENGTSYVRHGQGREVLSDPVARRVDIQVARCLRLALKQRRGGIALIVTSDRSQLKTANAVCMTKNRRHSASIYVNTMGTEKQNDIRYILRALRSRLGRDFNVDTAPENGKITVTCKSSNKINTMLSVCNLYHPTRKVIMISDDEVVKYRSRVTYCAVRNASAKYKKSADVLGKKSGARGLVEIIRYVTQ